MTSVKAEDVEALVDIFDESDWEELRVVLDGFEIYLSKNPADRDRHRHPGGAPAHSAPAIQLRSTARNPSVTEPGAADGLLIPDGMAVVRAPNLGTFYRAPKPGAAPYVSVGQKVEPETEICLIEVMKLFTTVRAGMAGTVREVFVQDAQLVEFDQPLFLIEPAVS